MELFGISRLVSCRSFWCEFSQAEGHAYVDARRNFSGREIALVQRDRMQMAAANSKNIGVAARLLGFAVTSELKENSS